MGGMTGGSGFESQWRHRFFSPCPACYSRDMWGIVFAGRHVQQDGDHLPVKVKNEAVSPFCYIYCGKFN
jgi:hypothetical protein